MSKSRFIKLRLKNHIIVHGYTNNNEEITEEVIVDKYSTKVIAVGRIKSLSEKYILTDYVEDHWIYWEYEEEFEVISEKLLSL